MSWGHIGRVLPFIENACPAHGQDMLLSCSNLQGGLHVTQLRQPAGSDVVIACTAKRQLMLWSPNPGAAFRTFTARPTWCAPLGSTTCTVDRPPLQLTLASLLICAPCCIQFAVSLTQSELAVYSCQYLSPGWHIYSRYHVSLGVCQNMRQIPPAKRIMLKTMCCYGQMASTDRSAWQAGDCLCLDHALTTSHEPGGTPLGLQ